MVRRRGVVGAQSLRVAPLTFMEWQAVKETQPCQR